MFAVLAATPVFVILMYVVPVRDRVLVRRPQDRGRTHPAVVTGESLLLVLPS